MRREALDGVRIFVIREFLSPEECGQFVTRSEQAGYDEASINTASGSVMNKDVRDNARLSVDDRELGEMLWQRARPLMPDRLQCSADSARKAMSIRPVVRPWPQMMKKK